MKAKYKELPWKQMAGMRDKLIHAYFGIDTETLWKTAKNNFGARTIDKALYKKSQTLLENVISVFL